MKETRYFYVPHAAEARELPDEEAVHAVRVLRMQSGDEMVLMDGCGSFFLARITVASSHHCQYEIIDALPQTQQWAGKIILSIAPTKLMDRMEWLTEKATEIGFDELRLLDCQFSERRVVKTQRLDKICVAAMKQSRKAWKPIVGDMMPFRKAVDTTTAHHRYIAHCYEEIPRVNLFEQLSDLEPSATTEVFIGPEGDFSIDEVRYAIDKGFVSVDLGKSRLRTETAGLASVMMMQLTKQK